MCIEGITKARETTLMINSRMVSLFAGPPQVQPLSSRSPVWKIPASHFLRCMHKTYEFDREPLVDMEQKIHSVEVLASNPVIFGPSSRQDVCNELVFM